MKIRCKVKVLCEGAESYHECVRAAMSRSGSRSKLGTSAGKAKKGKGGKNNEPGVSCKLCVLCFHGNEPTVHCVRALSSN